MTTLISLAVSNGVFMMLVETLLKLFVSKVTIPVDFTIVTHSQLREFRKHSQILYVIFNFFL